MIMYLANFITCKVLEIDSIFMLMYNSNVIAYFVLCKKNCKMYELSCLNNVTIKVTQ